MVEATQRLLDSPEVELWLAEADGEVIGSGRLDRVPGRDFAGIWGGAVAESWRGRGVYRCLTQARARAAVEARITFLYADCTVMSRVILAACGLMPITTTVPHTWRRDAQSR